ncbi:hypothetical protein BS47DRAFT_1392507 [Hydnum rufescens UP504]|uniref:Uncharacterized protein n=1 Tax=Hydnum rufescens UP504 TaxID=1448309 RepID=A0A9P6AYI1_9AGAM|nr:hypothetical protein BS47DRAFT_1392507 [Hydnum rufescens UP504]
MSEYYTETKAAAKSAADKHPPNIRERGMAVTNDVIDRCEDSYLAAKDYRIRVSKEHADKGLIVLFHRRLFVINNKQAHVDEQNHINLASHLKHHFDDATAKLEEAECTLEKLMIPVDDIKAAWAEQLSTQQAEPPRPEKDAGVKAIEAVLNLLKTQTSLRQQITITSNRQTVAALHDPSSPYCHELLDQLDQLQMSLEKIELQLAKKESDLLLHSKMTRADLDKIKSSQWYDALIHMLEHTTIGCHTLDHKARLHEAKVDKKRQPAIMRCLEQLNKQIQHMLDNWDDAPPGAIPPKTLDRKGLFSLDIDGVIWKGLHVLEAGLGDDRVPPRWLADENMRVAIITYLDLEGCQVKLDIIKWEVTNIHVWYSEEYNAIRAAIHEAETDPALRFHLSHKLATLEEVGATWDYSLRQLPYPAELQSVVQFMSRIMPPATISIHTLSTLAHEDGFDSDSEDCMEWNPAIPISEELKKIDDAEECSSEGFPDNASDSK